MVNTQFGGAPSAVRFECWIRTPDQTYLLLSILREATIKSRFASRIDICSQDFIRDIQGISRTEGGGAPTEARSAIPGGCHEHLLRSHVIVQPRSMPAQYSRPDGGDRRHRKFPRTGQGQRMTSDSSFPRSTTLPGGGLVHCGHGPLYMQ